MQNFVLNSAHHSTVQRESSVPSFQGKAAVVMGGAGAIGSAVAEALAKHGANVAVLDVQRGAADNVAKRIESLGRNAFAAHCDICCEEQIQSAVARTVEQFGRVDVLINAPGHGILKPLLEMTRAEFERNLSEYLIGAFLISKAVAASMIQLGIGGSIVHISSISSVRALGRGTGAYAAAKAGLNALIREMAVEWSPHRIRINAVAPCQVKTPGLERVLNSGLYGERETLTDKMLAEIPMRRFGEPEEIAWPCLFLASEAASLITGQVLFADGGNTAQ